MRQQTDILPENQNIRSIARIGQNDFVVLESFRDDLYK
jgi:hypothetical protein